MSFVGEIKRRKVFQVAAVYLVVAWLIMQVVDVINEPLRLPEWFATVVILLLIIGFPIALITSWAFELTPEGVVRDAGRNTTTRSRNRRIEYVLAVLLVVAFGWIGFREFTLTSPDRLPNSVAVLPFENLSADPEQAFFASGIHDTILNELAKISDINVIARTSVLPYANGETPIAQVADDLNVETVMEGTVQYAEGQVRITAQLIDPQTGSHVWSGNYDRPFADLFAVQTEIAERIAIQLEAELLPGELVSRQSPPTASPEAVELYMRAWESPTVELGLAYVDQAILADENFALAHALKAQLLTFGLIGVGGVDTASARDVEQALLASANRAIEIDPNLGVAHAALANVHMVNWRGAEAERAFQAALALSSNADTLMSYGRFKRYRGEREAAIPFLQQAARLDPNNQLRHNQLGIAYTRVGNYDAAARSLRRSLELSPLEVGSIINLALTEAARGNGSEAERLAVSAEQMNLPAGRFPQLAMVYRLVGRDDEAVRMYNEFERRALETGVSQAQWARAAVGVGRYDDALRYLRRAVVEKGLTDMAPLAGLAANPWGDAVLETPEFRELLDSLWD